MRTSRPRKGTEMDKIQDVAVIIGSLRKDPINRKTAHALAEVAPAGLRLSIVAIGAILFHLLVPGGR